MLRQLPMFVLLALVWAVAGCGEASRENAEVAHDSAEAPASQVSEQGGPQEEDRGMPLLIYVVEPAANPDAEEAFGCGDQLVPRTVYSQSGQDALAEVMKALLAPEHEEAGNYAGKGSLVFDSVSVDGPLMRVYTSGELQVAGVCDHPRIKEQFRATGMQFNGFDSVAVFIGMRSLDEYLGLK